MKILYLHQYYCPPGGHGNNRSYDFARYWAEAGHEVTVVTSPANFPVGHPANHQARFAYKEGKINVVSLGEPYAQQMGFFRRIWAFLRFFRKLMQEGRRLPKPDVVYASSTPLTVAEAGRRLARRWKVPLIFETVDVWPDVPIGMGIVRNPVLIWILHGLTNRIYRESKFVVALSEGMAEQVKRHVTASDKVVVIHNGADVEAFRSETRPAKDAEIVGYQPVKVLYAGALGYANGAGFLLEAARRVEERHPDILFVLDIYGWGSEASDLQRLAKRLGLRSVAFHPPVPKEQVPELMAGYDFGVITFRPFPVLEANSANKFYDYLAAGLPVLTNYEGWQAKYLTECGCGFSSPQGDEEAFVARFVELLQSKALRTKMGLAAHQLAEACFDRKILSEKALRLMTSR